MYLNPPILMICELEVAAFVPSSTGGIITAKIFNLFLPEKKKINYWFGADDISAIPMFAKVVQDFVLKHNGGKVNQLVAARGLNDAGLIGTPVGFIPLLGQFFKSRNFIKIFVLYSSTKHVQAKPLKFSFNFYKLYEK